MTDVNEAEEGRENRTRTRPWLTCDVDVLRFVLRREVERRGGDFVVNKTKPEEREGSSQ